MLRLSVSSKCIGKPLLHLLAGYFLFVSLVLAQAKSLAFDAQKLPLWPGRAGSGEDSSNQVLFRETSGQIVLSYADPENPGSRVTTRFWLQNRVTPSITMKISRGADDQYTYLYTIANASESKVPIYKWVVVGSPSPGTAVSHPAWRGFNSASAASPAKPGVPRAFLKNAGAGTNLWWTDPYQTSMIAAGSALSGFRLVSPLRPGLTVAYVSGLEPPITVAENVPESVVHAVTELQKPGGACQQQ